MADVASDLGVIHFIQNSDTVGKTLFVILVGMSLVSWYWILSKAWMQWWQSRHSQVFLEHFWNASSVEAVERGLPPVGHDDPFSHLAREAIKAKQHHAERGVARLEEAGTANEYLTRTLRKCLDAETASLESGLTILASIASTAPFIGLFGTVWGIYHALIAISVEGGGTLEKVAGPVGEALIMTALGLAVAIPAVLGFNAFSRGNRVLLARLDAFAHELFTVLSMGYANRSPSSVTQKDA